MAPRYFAAYVTSIYYPSNRPELLLALACKQQRADVHVFTLSKV
jgi:hypothetical protein